MGSVIWRALLNACLKCGEGTSEITRKAAELRTFWLGCASRYVSTQSSIVPISQERTMRLRATWIESQSSAACGHVLAKSHTWAIKVEL